MAARDRSFLHESFEVGIAMKGFDGLLEFLGGAIIFFMKPSQMNDLVRKICEPPSGLGAERALACGSSTRG